MIFRFQQSSTEGRSVSTSTRQPQQSLHCIYHSIAACCSKDKFLKTFGKFVHKQRYLDMCTIAVLSHSKNLVEGTKRIDRSLCFIFFFGHLREIYRDMKCHHKKTVFPCSQCLKQTLRF